MLPGQQAVPMNIFDFIGEVSSKPLAVPLQLVMRDHCEAPSSPKDLGLEGFVLVSPSVEAALTAVWPDAVLVHR